MLLKSETIIEPDRSSSMCVTELHATTVYNDITSTAVIQIQMLSGHTVIATNVACCVHVVKSTL